MNSCVFTALTPIQSGCKFGVVRLSAERCYRMVYGESLCCLLVGGRLDSVGAVVSGTVTTTLARLLRISGIVF
jgi:hypothetical protein